MNYRISNILEYYRIITIMRTGTRTEIFET